MSATARSGSRPRSTGGCRPATSRSSSASASRSTWWPRPTRRFSDEFGLTPKLAARVVRFGRAREMLELPTRPSIAEVATVCGYYDQPHLNRDFVELAGCPPGEWLASEVPSIQDRAAPRASSSAA